MLVMLITIAVFLLLGVPIAFALGCGSAAALFSDQALPLVLVPQRMFAALDSWPIMAIPLFMLTGVLMDRGGISRRIVDFSGACFGFIRGSLGMVAVLASMVFAGISGSSTADTAAVGAILLPEMKKKGYDMSFASALQAAAGAIGPIIPPSILMILIGYVTDTSVARLFLAGVIPGVLIGFGLMGMNALHAARGGEAYLRTQKFRLREVARTGREALPGLGLPFIIVFGILAGIFTATEAAAVAVLYGLLVGALFYREIKVRDIPGILVEAAEKSCVILFIAAAAMLFAWLVTVKQIPRHLADFLSVHIHSQAGFLVVLNLALLFIGMFMESFSAIIVFLPILFPIALEFGVDPVHFGVIATVNLAVGYITPPYGATLFVACGISGVPVRAVSRRVFPLIGVMLVILLLVTYWPGLYLWMAEMVSR